MALPLIAIAASLLPELVRLMAGDRAGTAATQVAEAVRTITGTDDPAQVQATLAADPAKATELRVKLAEIALEQQRIQTEAEDKRRQAELDAFKARTADVADARSKTLALAQQGSSIAWGAPVMSTIIVLGFFAVLMLMIFKPFNEEARNTIQLLNIVIGALVASFTAVVNFWLGSSEGSRSKDETVRSLQAAQVTTTAQAMREVREIAQTATTSAAASRPAEIIAPLGIAALPGSAGENFAACLDIVLQQEGGFSDHPEDPGGATKFGITLKTLADFREKPVTREDVQALTKDEAKEIYRTNYWNPMRCNELPRGVDLMTFDFGVNAGPRTAVRVLQRAAGVTDDGSIGPITLAAIRAHQPANLLNRMAEERMKHYRALATFDTFGTGWSNRNEAVKQAALRMAMEAPK